MIKLHQFELSGHCHKARVMLRLLKLPHELVNVDGARLEHKSETHLAKNPFGQVPVLEDGDLLIRDSQAILYYLAVRYGEGRWLPTSPALGAEVMAWLSVASAEVSAGPGALLMSTNKVQPVRRLSSARNAGSV